MTKTNSKLLSLLTISLISFGLSSCSVILAARKSGTDISQVQAARYRAQILATGATVVSSERDSYGNLVEVYNVPKEKGSTIRAIMHGMLDLSTMGFWEIIGTPIECALNQPEFFTLRVTYDPSEAIRHVELI